MTLTIKLFGIILIVLCCAALGFFSASRLTRRERDLRWYAAATQSIKQKIRYSSAELPEILEEIYGRENYYSVSVPLKVRLKKSGLNRSDEEVIGAFFSSLGSADREAEMSRCDSALMEINFRTDSAIEQNAKQSKLCRSLGVLGGIAVGIMLL